jgi:hypothetical protein
VCGSGPTRSLAKLPGKQCCPNPTRSQPSAPDLTPPPLTGAQCGSGPTRSLAILPGKQCRPNPTRSQPSAPDPPPSTLRASAALPAGRLPDLTPSPLEGVRCGSDLTRSLALMPGTQCGPNLTLSLPPAPTGVQCDSGLTQSLALVPGSQCDPNLTLSQPLLPPLWLPPLAPLPVMRSACAVSSRSRGRSSLPSGYLPWRHTSSRHCSVKQLRLEAIRLV